MEAKGLVHSIQSLGTLDGPGVRFVVFLQGCPLRCHCCHNPDTWDLAGGTEYGAQQLVQTALRYKSYFGEKGGVTLSGGEPLLQSAFAENLFALCHQNGLNTCLDTSGCILDDGVKKLLSQTDRVLLDIKYTKAELYEKHVGCSLDSVLAFLGYLDGQKIPVTLRQVIIPTLNDDADNILRLRTIASQHAFVDGVELLPFRKICQTKYDMLHMPFPFGHLPTPAADKMDALKRLLGEYAK
ncbi:MAG: pyruvate formate lyase-activating protein [Clostridiales bacterium]|nr:pyruvate formate lyase-activating protein [Clostridiales bacterium]